MKITHGDFDNTRSSTVSGFAENNKILTEIVPLAHQSIRSSAY